MTASSAASAGPPGHAPLTPDRLPRNLPERIVGKVRRMIRDARRDTIRRVALALPPSPPVAGNEPYSVHMLVCRRDLDMAIITAKSLNLAVGRPLAWVFHDDGSAAGERSRLLGEFPGTTVVTREESDPRMATRLATRPELMRARRQYVLMLKLLDFREWTRGERFFLMDSDILFFDRPDALLDALDAPGTRNVFNRDIETTYVRPEERLGEIIGGPVPPRINSGLGAINTADVDYDRVAEWFTAIDRDGPFHPHRIEQSLFAMVAAASPAGAGHLPSEYDVAFGKDVRGAVCKHYVGWIRHGFELEGLAFLLSERDFETRWRAFARA